MNSLEVILVLDILDSAKGTRSKKLKREAKGTISKKLKGQAKRTRSKS